MLRAWLKKVKPQAVISTLATSHRLQKKIGVSVPEDILIPAISVLDGDFDAGVEQNSFAIGEVAMRTLAAMTQQN